MGNTQTFLEVEAKFSVSTTTSLPDPLTFPGVAAVVQTREEQLSAVYFDTADLRLTRAKITLRRRTGGHDDGWHLKLPGDYGRLEVRAELGEEDVVPAELMTHIRPLVRRQPLVKIAQVDNSRTELVLAADTGEAIAELSDDRVSATSFLPAGKMTAWREWEVELTESQAGTQLLHDISAVLIAAGAFESESPSKLRTALGDSFDHAPLPPALRKAEVDKKSPAAAVIKALAANRDKLHVYEPKVRANEWDSVHQMRVATRELRSHLETFHGVVSGPEVEYLEAELKELATLLGVARDAEVVEERWQKLLDSEDSDVLDAATREHLAKDMGRDYARAHRRVIGALNSDRYLDFLEALDEFLINPPVHVAAAEEKPQEAHVESVMVEHLEQAYAKLRKRHKKAVKNWQNPELSLHQREDYFHDMRKAAKKLRYAAEAAGAATDLKTKPLYKACKEMQSVLGDFQDSVTSRDKLGELANAARRRGEDTFGYGLLYQRERAIGLKALEDYEQAMRAITKAFKKLG